MDRLTRLFAPALLATALALAGCGKGEPQAVEVVAIGTDRPGIDNPVRGELSYPEQVAMSAMAQGLVRLDGNGDIVPGLAERWNMTDDGLSYIFRLGSGEWPDGREITAHEAARHLKRQLARGSRNPLGDTLGAIEDIVAMTDRVIEIRLTAPRPNLLNLLAQPEMAVIRNGMGTGPFSRLDDGDEDDSGSDVIRMSYRERIIEAPDIIERVNLRSAEAADAIQLFKDEEVSLVLGGTFANLPLVREADVSASALRFDPVAGLFGLVPARRNGPAADADLRRLLSQAIDRETFIDALDVPGLLPRSSLLQADLDGVEAPEAAESPFAGSDREEALAAAGRTMFGDSEPPTIAVAIPEGPGGDLLLNRLAGDWGILGIEVVRAGDDRPADFILVDLVAPSNSPAWFVRQFRCGMVAICLADADEAMDEARTATNVEERNALLAEAARLLEERSLFIAIAAPIRWSLVSSDLPGFVENPAAVHTLVGLTRAPSAEGRP